MSAETNKLPHAISFWCFNLVTGEALCTTWRITQLCFFNMGEPWHDDPIKLIRHLFGWFKAKAIAFFRDDPNFTFENLRFEMHIE